MKLFSFLLLLALVAMAFAQDKAPAATGATGATGAESEDMDVKAPAVPAKLAEEADKGDEVKAAAKTDAVTKEQISELKKLIEATEKAAEEKRKIQRETCAVELAEHEKWVKEIDDNKGEREQEAADRKVAKQELVGALDARIGTMKKFLTLLEGIKQTLGGHIYRTNKLYGGAYTAITLDVTLTVEIMHDLGVMNNFHVSPIFHPILLPKKDSVDLSSPTPPTVPEVSANKDALPAPASEETKKATEGEDPNLKKIDDKSSAALMEVASQVHKAVYGCKKLEAEGKKDACAAGYNKAYEIYELGLSYVRMNKVEFEEERRVLGSFREELKGLIALKKWRINYMEKQKAALVASISADAAAPIEAILKKIKEHKAIISKSCTDMQARSKEAQKELADIEKVVSEMYTMENSATATGAATGASSAAAADTAQESKKVEEPKKAEGPTEEKAAEDKVPAEQKETVVNKE